MEIVRDIASCLTVIHDRAGDVFPAVGIVLGSGLGGLADRVEEAVSIPYGDLPGFPVSSVPGHAGRLVAGWLDDVPVLLFAGRSHFYERRDAAAMRLPLAVLKALGARALVLSNAAGSTRSELSPGTLMLITDHINWSGRNPLIGLTGDAGFVDMTSAYDADFCDALRLAAVGQSLALAEGIYGWFSGPSYETPAEIRMAAALGVDAVGMSTVPETILARSMGLRVAAVSLITNLGAGIGSGTLSHREVKDEGARAAARFEGLIIGALPTISAKTDG